MAGIRVPSDSPVQPALSSSYNELMNAISTGAAEVVREHINAKPELINTPGWHRQTPLHRACLVGYADIVRLLLDAGADPNARNNFDETPLHYACKRGLPPVLHAVLAKGGDITLVDKVGKGGIHHAAEAGSVPALHMLQSLYPDLTFTCQDSNLQTPVHLAVKAGKLDAFKYLMRKGRSNMKCPDKDGNWPIHLSTQEGYGHITWSQLCIVGASALDVCNKHGCTPYQLANMYDTPAHKELQSELEWLRFQPKRASVKLHAYILWFYNFLLPAFSYGAAIVVTRFMSKFQALIFFPVVVFIIVTARKSLHRLNHVSRWTQPLLAGAFAAGLFHTILVYLVIMLPYIEQYTSLWLLSLVLIVMVIGVYIKLLCTDPGVMVNSDLSEVTLKPLTILDVCTSDKWQNFCSDCEIIQACFTKHCKLCNSCMRGMDHHCLFLLRCIARDNHVIFVWFILLCLLCMNLFVYGIYLYTSQVYPALLWREILSEMLSSDAWVLTMFLLNCGAILWGWSILLYQYNMISNGYTAYFRPREFHGDILSGYEKLMNVIFFFMKREPYIVNPSIYVIEPAEIV